VEKSGQLLRRVLLHRRQGMRVDAERHLNLGVAQSTLNDVSRNARRQHQRRYGVAEAMELDPADARFLYQRVELPLPYRIHLQRQPKPLRLSDVRRVHSAVHNGYVALKASSTVRRATAEEIRQHAIGGRLRGRTWTTGWQLPKHRTSLRLLPQPAGGEQTSMLALFEAADEVSAIVAAFGYFLWRHAPTWRECACERCGLTFITNGKQRYIEGHQAAKWQREFRRRKRARQMQRRV
jgi:hypothetical protein